MSFYNDDPFTTAQQPHRGASPLMSGGEAETWYENEHGCFSLSSGKFIPKGDSDSYFKPRIDIACKNLCDGDE